MTRTRATILVLTFGVALAGTAVAVGVGQRGGERAATRANFVAVKWPFPRDQWGDGRAFQCAAADCGTVVELFVRAKIGFCNCDTGVADDAELDRVGDLELYSPRFVGLGDGREVRVGWMLGRSRPYRVDVPYAQPRTAQVIAFNQNCDVMVATVVAPSKRLAEADRLALEFLNGDTVLKWARAEFGI